MYSDPFTEALKTKTLYHKNLQALKENVREWLQEYYAGNNISKSIKVAEWVNIWLTNVKNSIKDKTYENYDTTMRNHLLPNFGKMKLSKINAEQLQRYFNQLLDDHTTRTVATIRTHFIVCFNAAIRFGYLKINPAKLTSPPHISPRSTIALTQQQITKLESVLERGDYFVIKPDETDEGRIYLQKCYLMLFRLTLNTGMREGEVFGLKWSKINFEKQSLYIDTAKSSARGKLHLDTPKNVGSIRSIFLSSSIIKKLKEWQVFQTDFAIKYKGVFNNKYDLVFTNINGGIISISNFRTRCFAPALRIAGIKGANFYSLRHTHASQLLATGLVNVQVVAERLGHSSVTTTMDIYAHLLPTMQESVRNVLEKLDQGKTIVEEEKANDTK